MLKRGLSVFLAAALMILCFFSVPAFAAAPEFDISDYTIEDLETMTTAEKKKLMENFIEAYNPYGIRDLMEQEASASGGFGVQPLWKSDSDSSEDGQQIATHQMVTLQAMLMFMLDYGFYDVDASIQLVIALYVAAASGLPDLDETDGIFAEHFYDPITGCGLNLFLDSARDNVADHYRYAHNVLAVNPYLSVTSEPAYYIWEQLGRALHYIQDVCEPHHASSAAAGVSTHTQFEDHVENNIESLLPQRKTMPNSSYAVAKGKTAGELTHDAALTGRSRYKNVWNLGDKSKWDATATACLDDAVCYSARLIYKLFADCNVIV